MKAKGVNWKNWEKVLAIIKSRKPRQVNMGTILGQSIDGNWPDTFEEAHESCGTAGCIAGWTAMTFMKTGEPRDINYRRLLINRFNLEDDESVWVYQGWWGNKDQKLLGKGEVVRYMQKALKARDVMVKL